MAKALVNHGELAELQIAIQEEYSVLNKGKLKSEVTVAIVSLSAFLFCKRQQQLKRVSSAKKFFSRSKKHKCMRMRIKSQTKRYDRISFRSRMNKQEPFPMMWYQSHKRFKAGRET